MALTTSFRRSKKNIDYKRLHEGDSLPRSILTKKECVRDSTVLPRKYLVERIICSKSTHEVILMHGGIGRFSGQGVEKINDQIKQIHQKRSNKSDQTVDDLKTRKRIEYLIDQDCEQNKAQYNKHNEKYWSTTIREKQNSKRRRINFEISSAHEQFEKENEIPIEVMSTEEVKQKLKKLGILTKVRKHDKLVQLLRNKMDE